ncbi:MAG: DegT/DnrJ/EryC1/StrS aminotransferase family protein [Candidatus Levybacteria bacterium]|nr:DegT/DnrJ/EryC1/StrS aminotransferase family protein [Candidatus Levybacteria bacterium]
MKRPIAISLSPNTQNSDILASLSILFSPWKVIDGDSVRLLEQWFHQFFDASFAVSFVSGRGALYAILKSLGIGEGDEILLQSFTCVAVPNSVIATGAVPIYVDINNSLTINIKELEKKITQKTKAIIVQHTFGIPADINRIMEIAKKHKIKVIEDCAHSLGIEYLGKKLGSFGDAAFFSFGRDKCFSSVFGGVALTNNETLGKKLQIFQKQQGNIPFFWTIQQLLHPISFFFILPLYNFFSLGKVILVILQSFNLLSFPVTKEEKSAKMSKNLLKRMPNGLAYLAFLQLGKIKNYNKRRKDISKVYLSALDKSEFKIPCQKQLAFLRFPIFSEKRDKIIFSLKRKGIYVGKWYSEVIDPKGVDFEKIYYRAGSCPNAEFLAKRIINLPTYPLMTTKDAKNITEIINNA